MSVAKGFFLVLEGADGSGKSSQLELLAEFFRHAGRTVHTVHFPRLDARPYGELIAGFLRGDFGRLDAVHPQLAALLYALDRADGAEDLRCRLAAGEVVLADRYILSNRAYQCAKVPDPEAREHLADWIERFEYGHNAIPRPDLTLYLDAPAGFARAALAGRREGLDSAHPAGGRDIHEDSASLQERVRGEFHSLCRERPGEIGAVDCRGADGGMADRQTVHSRVIDALRYYGVISR